MRKIKKIVKKTMVYFFLFYFLINGLYQAINGYFFYGASTIMLTILVEPLFNKFLNKRFNLSIPGRLKYLFVVIILVINEIAQPKGGYFEIAIILIFASFFYLLYKSRKKNEIDEEKKLKKAAANKKILQNKGLYIIVERFVKKYARLEFVSNQEVELDHIDKRQIDNLTKLINSKDVRFSTDEIIILVKKEIKSQDYAKFKRRIMVNKPKSLPDYIRIFVGKYGFYGNYKSYYLEFLEALLKEGKVYCMKESLIKEIESKIEKNELENFEIGLKNSDGKKIVTINQIDYMNGYQFQSFLRELFERMGYSVEKLKLSWDQGADLVVNKFGVKTIIQAKRYKEKVTNKAVQEIVAALKHYKADKGMVVTTSNFTYSAVELAKSNNVELVDRMKLKDLINEYL